MTTEVRRPPGRRDRRRTTVSAPSDVLDTLVAEARRRGVPLNDLLSEAVEEKADRLRQRRRPRFGVVAAEGFEARTATSDPVAEDFRG